MTENTTTDEHVYKYKNDQSIDDMNNSSILLNQYQSFILDDYSFIIGTTDNESIYMECKINEKFYKKIISKKNLYVINEKFQAYKDINEIYKIIFVSITNNQIDITNLKNNKIKFTLSVTMDDNKPSIFEIILREEKNKNDAVIYKIEQRNREGALAKDNNDQISELHKDHSDSIFMEDFKKDILANYKKDHNIDDLKKKKKEKKNNNMIEEEEEEEDDYNYNYGKEFRQNINKQNNTNNLIEIINNLKSDLLYLKNVVNKNEQNNNEEKIKELEKNNNNLVEEITKIKNDLKILFEESQKAKEEINFLKKSNININNINTQLEILNNTEEQNNTIKELMGMSNSNNRLIKTVTIDDTKYNSKNNSSKKKILKKEKKIKSKSQRKSVIFSNNNNDDSELGSLNIFIFKQKYCIRENEAELDLTNKMIGDRGLELLSRIQFHKLKSLSLDNNGIYVINSLSNLVLNDLQVLNLDNNNISDISILEVVKFPSLQVLWLNNNNISDISVLEKVKFSQLQHLYLNNNNISDISVFKKVYFNKLERLYLLNNKIEDISCFAEVELNKLQLIYLNKNRIDFNLSRNKELIQNLKKKLKYLYY